MNLTLRMGSDGQKYGRGLGDNICGLYAAVGAARAGHEVTYLTRHPEWFGRVSCPGLTILSHANEGFDLGGGDENYVEQLKRADDRKEWYCKNVEIAGGPSFKPSRDFSVDREPRSSFPLEPGYVALAPFAARGGSARNWPAFHWARLARALHYEGRQVQVVASAIEDKHCREAFGACPPGVKWETKWTASDLIDLVLGSAAVIGNDSGLAHVAAMLGVPTIAIHAHIEPQVVFSCTDVVSVVPDASCVGCRWLPERGYGDCCQIGCSALATVGPERVLAELKRLLEKENHGGKIKTKTTSK